MASEAIQRKCLNSPDETRTLENGEVGVVALGDFTASRLLLEPGWSWSENVRPIAGTDSCQVLHTGYNGSNRSGGSVVKGVEREDASVHGPPQARGRADRRSGSRGAPEGPANPGQAWSEGTEVVVQRGEGGGLLPV